MCLPQPLSQPLARWSKGQTSTWEAQSTLKTRPPWSKVQTSRKSNVQGFQYAGSFMLLMLCPFEKLNRVLTLDKSVLLLTLLISV